MRLPWIVVGVVVAVLAAGVLLLDRRQAARGQPSLLSGFGWPEAARPPASRARASRRPARVAVIVDELGGRGDVAERVLALRRPVSVAVLPELPLSRRIARDAARAGLEVLVQLPLEPYRFPEADPGPGRLLASMPPAEVTRRTRQHLAAVPGAVGVMTHMGSRFTEDRRQMRAVLEPVLLQGLFFVDSLTTPRSVGYDLARALGVPAGRRQVFVDPDESEATARARLRAVERWAASRGGVLAVAHGRLLTLRLLEETLPEWEARGLRLVPVSELVKAEMRAAGTN
jgi:polysaccharide deacetylase 2 family uncharacterized protein YibQ